MAKPKNLVNITIHGAARNAALERYQQKQRVVKQWIQDYQRAGQEITPWLREQARLYGIITNVL